jgi:hypothetical protein
MASKYKSNKIQLKWKKKNGVPERGKNKRKKVK